MSETDKPAGLPESWYYSDTGEKWIMDLIKRAVREVLAESHEHNPDRDFEDSLKAGLDAADCERILIEQGGRR